MATTEHQIDADGPHELWSKHGYITDSKLFREYVERLVNGRDMHVIVTASSETGVGKTTLAVSLALLWDQQGWTAEKAAVADAAEYSYKYDNAEPGTVLILDEAEKAADARRGMSSESVEVSQAFAAKRFRQVFGILTAPSKSWVDKRLGSSAADYWIQALETDTGGIKGEARVYRLKEQEHYETFYTDRTETISWPVLDDNAAFKELDRIKKNRLSGGAEAGYVPRERVEEEAERNYKKASMRMRYDMLCAMYEWGISQADISRILRSADELDGLSQQRVGQIVNAESFEDVYSI